MAKEKRFPSPANVEVDKSGKPVVSKAPAGPLPAKAVEGKKAELVQVHYSGDNAVILHNGVHSIANGLNHIAKEIWDEAKKMPNIAAHLKKGEMKEMGKGDAKADAPADDEADEASESDQSA